MANGAGASGGGAGLPPLAGGSCAGGATAEAVSTWSDGAGADGGGAALVAVVSAASVVVACRLDFFCSDFASLAAVGAGSASTAEEVFSAAESVPALVSTL